jgi:hypothetical protein
LSASTHRVLVTFSVYTFCIYCNRIIVQVSFSISDCYYCFFFWSVEYLRSIVKLFRDADHVYNVVSYISMVFTSNH